MKIFAVTRTLNEEKIVGRYCRNYYHWVDQILIADGGSSDRTVEIAKQQPKTQVRPFHQRKPMKNNRWRNPEAEHIQFLVDWAVEEGADWILLDDCDCWPNYMMKLYVRDRLENTQFDFVYAVRLYLWWDNMHYPKMAQPAKEGVWEASMWGFRANIGVQFYNTNMAYSWKPKIDSPDQRLDLMPPYCLLHNWQYNRDRKIQFYRESGQIPEAHHPRNSAGQLEPLPRWAYE